MVESAQNFQLTQVGLSAFQWEEASSQYVARTFNFWIFPRPGDGFDPRFLCQVGADAVLLPCCQV
jgi:CAF1 family ribonuclease